MKKQISLMCLLIIIGISVSAQNWKPFYKGDTVNYKFHNSAIITNTIWVDSAKIVGSDSVFYLNRVFLNCDTCLHIPGYLNCDTCFALDNQPQFLQRTIVKKENGRYLLNDTSDFVLLTKAQLNDSWMFNVANAISAQVVDVSLQNILGVYDSVKTIILSNEDTIKLSKNHGIIQFPNLFGIGNYLLVGIENRNLGEKVPDFWDIYNFDVGDVFQYEGLIHNNGLQNHDEYIRKIYILSKTITQNEVDYFVHVVFSGVRYWIGPGGYWIPYSGTINEHLEYINYPFYYLVPGDIIVNYFNYEKFDNDPCYNPGFPTQFSYKTLLTVDSLNILTKKIGDIDPLNNHIVQNSYFKYNSIPDLYMVTAEALAVGTTTAEYKVGLGRTSYYKGCFELIIEYELLRGYVKNGDTVGTITPDSIIVNMNSYPQTLKNNIVVYPNPFTESTTIEIKGKGVSFPCTLDVYDIYGKLIFSEKIKTDKYVFNKPLPHNEIYLYLIKDALNNIIGKGKMIVQ